MSLAASGYGTKRASSDVRDFAAAGALHARTKYGQNMQLLLSPKYRPDHSGFMPANLSTLAHFSISRAIMLPNSAGELPDVA